MPISLLPLFQSILPYSPLSSLLNIRICSSSLPHIHPDLTSYPLPSFLTTASSPTCSFLIFPPRPSSSYPSLSPSHCSMRPPLPSLLISLRSPSLLPLPCVMHALPLPSLLTMPSLCPSLRHTRITLPPSCPPHIACRFLPSFSYPSSQTLPAPSPPPPLLTMQGCVLVYLRANYAWPFSCANNLITSRPSLPPFFVILFPSPLFFPHFISLCRPSIYYSSFPLPSSLVFSPLPAPLLFYVSSSSSDVFRASLLLFSFRPSSSSLSCPPPSLFVPPSSALFPSSSSLLFRPPSSLFSSAPPLSLLRPLLSSLISSPPPLALFVPAFLLPFSAHLASPIPSSSSPLPPLPFRFSCSLSRLSSPICCLSLLLSSFSPYFLSLPIPSFTYPFPAFLFSPSCSPPLSSFHCPTERSTGCLSSLSLLPSASVPFPVPFLPFFPFLSPLLPCSFFSSPSSPPPLFAFSCSLYCSGFPSPFLFRPSALLILPLLSPLFFPFLSTPPLFPFSCLPLKPLHLPSIPLNPRTPYAFLLTLTALPPFCLASLTPLFLFLRLHPPFLSPSPVLLSFPSPSFFPSSRQPRLFRPFFSSRSR
ncbi:hypothetical protein C7M84_009880 [Penaeus vannamei]|uniref:Uncharacterized protein n=1 Tax=Penaeus vannamei TaxID=6689 RepID=A0A3R7SRE9_PENVA|nr:hypothetical protein C7M84_009880 [Penaeus vannamei]